MTIDKKKFIEKYVKALESNTAAIFAGAGLSCGAGYVNWKTLLNDAAEELDLSIEKEEHDLVGLAQHYINKKRSRGNLNSVIMEQFSRRAELTENHKLLAKLPIDTYWTTNYDHMIEKALDFEGRIVDVKRNQNQLTVSVADKDATVYKMHGDIDSIDKIVLTRDDYEKYNMTHPKFREILEGDLLSKTFLFIGFSFTDPNIGYVLSRIRLVLEDNTRPHYCILKEVEESEYDTHQEFIYAQIKQKLHIEDLSRFSIETILVKNYSEITEILEKVYKRYKRKTIFISGSAVEYSPFNFETGKYFLHQLSKQLVRNDFKLVSGFGLGVGSYVINGVADYISTNKKSRLQNHLNILPFPQDTSGDLDLKEVWETNRNEMISDCGMALFLFGNKNNKDNTEVILADGLEDEYRIAKTNELITIPIKITGYKTSELSRKYDEEINSQFNENVLRIYKEINESTYDVLDEKNIDEIVQKIVSLVIEIKKSK
ncbi:SIR2 family protein [Exiguobacterium sp. ERU656]|uniref:SIR2 family protein n=1 Tax=Exiguobacterium sp. ERU656 TaxID=2751217 RepID=UPI001BE9F13F|nr:SIR2 family protein [Exiguobacterium sp. ERU656]